MPHSPKDCSSRNNTNARRRTNTSNFQWSPEDEKGTIISTTHVITFLVVKETAPDNAFQAAN